MDGHFIKPLEYPLCVCVCISHLIHISHIDKNNQRSIHFVDGFHNKLQIDKHTHAFSTAQIIGRCPIKQSSILMKVDIFIYIKQLSSRLTKWADFQKINLVYDLSNTFDQ